jgi:hypothetical protein
MFCLDVAVACRFVSSTNVFLWGSSWSCVDVIHVLLVCRYMTAFSPCFCSLYLGEVLCIVCDGCETELIFNLRGEHKFHIYTRTRAHTDIQMSKKSLYSFRRLYSLNHFTY